MYKGGQLVAAMVMGCHAETDDAENVPYGLAVCSLEDIAYVNVTHEAGFGRARGRMAAAMKGVSKQFEEYSAKNPNFIIQLVRQVGLGKMTTEPLKEIKKKLWKLQSAGKFEMRFADGVTDAEAVAKVIVSDIGEGRKRAECSFNLKKSTFCYELEIGTVGDPLELIGESLVRAARELSRGGVTAVNVREAIPCLKH